MADILGMLDAMIAQSREEDKKEERQDRLRRKKMKLRRLEFRRRRRGDDLPLPLDDDFVAVLESDDDHHPDE